MCGAKIPPFSLGSQIEMVQIGILKTEVICGFLYLDEAFFRIWNGYSALSLNNNLQ